MGSYLNQSGLTKVLTAIKSWGTGAFVAKVSGKDLSTNDFTDAYKTKLDGIATGATANAGTITGIKMNGSSKGTSGVVDLGSVATLGSDGKVPAAQLPSFVDDVLEGYLNSGKFYTTRSGSSGSYSYSGEITAETGKIYVDLSNSKTYRWSGSAYSVISETLALGETSSTAYRGDRGKTAYDHSQATHAPTDAQKNVQTDWNATSGDAKLLNKPTTIAGYGITDAKINNGTITLGSNTLTPATSGHSHGYILSTGLIDQDGWNVPIANNNRLPIYDTSDGINVSNVIFDASTTTKALTPKGTWETFLQSHQDISGKQDKITSSNKLDYSLLSNTPTFTKTYDDTTKTLTLSALGSSWSLTGYNCAIDLNGTASEIEVPDATTTVKGVTTVGASGGAAAYSHTHSYTNDSALTAANIQTAFTDAGFSVTIS